MVKVLKRHRPDSKDSTSKSSPPPQRAVKSIRRPVEENQRPKSTAPSRGYGPVSKAGSLPIRVSNSGLTAATIWKDPKKRAEFVAGFATAKQNSVAPNEKKTVLAKQAPVKQVVFTEPVLKTSQTVQNRPKSRSAQVNAIQPNSLSEHRTNINSANKSIVISKGATDSCFIMQIKDNSVSDERTNPRNKSEASSVPSTESHLFLVVI